MRAYPASISIEAVTDVASPRIIVDTDAAAIASRVSRPRPDTTEIIINEQTIKNAYQTVMEKMQQRMGQL